MYSIVIGEKSKTWHTIILTTNNNTKYAYLANNNNYNNSNNDNNDNDSDIIFSLNMHVKARRVCMA